MDIFPLGHAAFKLRGKAASIVCDPYNPEMVGLNFPKHTQADIVTVSHAHEDHNFLRVVEKLDNGEMLVISGPGEYEAKGIEITGVASFHDTKKGQERGKNTIYKIHMEELTLVHCGDLGHILEESEAEFLEDIDILMIPVGGVFTIDAHTAAKVVAQLEPLVIIPMHYQRLGLNPKVFSGLLPVTQFLKEIGQEGVTPQPKLKIGKDTLPSAAQVVVLE